MTRFARGKGSKSSNERVPEGATSWQEMKQNLIESQHKTHGKEHKKLSNNSPDRVKSLDLAKAKPEWSVFPNMTEVKKKVETQSDNVEVIKTKKLKKGKKKDLVGEGFIANEASSTKLKKPKKKNQKINEPTDDATTKVNSKGSKQTVEGTQDEATKSEKKIKTKQNTKSGIKAVTTQESNASIGTTKSKKRKSHDGLELVKPKKLKTGNLEETPDLNTTKIKKQKKDKLNRSNDLSQQGQKVNQANKRPQNNKNDVFSNKNQDFPNSKNGQFANRNQQFTKGKNAQFSNKNKLKKERNGDFKRRKPVTNTIIINGAPMETMFYDGFPIKVEDYERLEQLKRDMKNKGIPLSEINKALKLERRRAEKSLARAKKSVCFNCRQGGHNISDCPNLKTDNPEMAETGICFKCGSTQHTYFQCKVVHDDSFKFAQCFICKERGHISRQCPDNKRGIYPKGGACKLCGDVTHLKQDCPKRQIEQEENKFMLDTIGDRVEDLDKELVMEVVKQAPVKRKVIKF